ncbi:unnamed protein product [Urochloa humidicola]
MHETTLNKLDGLSVHEGGVHDEDGDGGVDDAAASSEDHDRDEQDAASEDSDDDDTVPWGNRAVQVLAIRANFPILAINGYDWVSGRCIYIQPEGEVQEEGMVDLVPIGPRSPLMAYGYFTLEVFPSTTTASNTTPTGEEGSSRVGPRIREGWDVCGGYDDDEEPEEYTQTICAGSDRILEITYLVIPSAMEAEVEVRLKLKDLGSRSRVYGKIKASSTDYGNKSIHLFNCERGMSLSFPSGSSSSILPLSPSVIALPSLPHRREFQLEVDLTVVTIYDNQAAKIKKFKFTGLKLSHKVRSQQREVDGDQVEVNVTWSPVVAM